MKSAYGSYDRPAYRSRGEKTIADFLGEVGIPFEYEAPLLVRDRGRPKLWYPDSSLPDYGQVIEYFGVVGDPAYDRLKRKKATVYRRNNIPAVFLEPRDLEGDWQKKLLDEVGSNLAARLDAFEKLRSGYESNRRGKNINIPVFLE